MADVTDPEAVRFVSQQVRPLCERARALMAEITSMSVTWFAGKNTVIGTGSGHVIEARSSEGVNDLTEDQVTNAVANLIAVAAAGNSQVLSVPCVRPLTVV